VTWWNYGGGVIMGDGFSEWHQTSCSGILFEVIRDNYRLQLLCECRTVILC